MRHDEITNQYFRWLYDLVCENRHHPDITWNKLLSYLHSTEFVWLIPKDQNRAEDGLNLRWRFAMQEKASDESADDIFECLDGPCSVLELMIALAIRCEEDYMDDPMYGNRVAQWFWGMIANLGLGSMFDTNYDKRYVEEAVHKFLYRKYEPDGKGGLFRIRNYSGDIRKLEIWYQMCYFLDSFV